MHDRQGVSKLKVPIILYHRLAEDEKTAAVDPGEGPYLISRETFFRQMEHLYQQNYCPITVAEYIELKDGSSKITPLKKNIIITFDDGHVSVYDLALPVLRQYNFVATVFMTTDRIGMPPWMSWEQLKEMSDCGFEIGSHSKSHPILTQLDRGEVERELRISREVLEKGLNRKVISLSIPGGFYDDRVRNITRSLGYHAVCTSDWGVNRFDNRNFFALRRLGIKREVDFRDFVRLINMDPFTISRYRCKYLFRKHIKKVLGLSLYRWLRKTMFQLRKGKT